MTTAATYTHAYLSRGVGGDLAGSACAALEVLRVWVAEQRHRRAGLVVVDRRAGLRRDVAIGRVGEHAVEHGDELVVHLLAPVQRRRRHRGVDARQYVVQRRVRLRALHPLAHRHARVTHHAALFRHYITLPAHGPP
jgi:hypothetical protein